MILVQKTLGILGMLLSTPIIAVCKTIFVFFDKKYGIITKKEKEPEITINVSKVKNVKKKSKLTWFWRELRVGAT